MDGIQETDGMTLESYWTHMQNTSAVEDVLVFEMRLKHLYPRYYDHLKANICKISERFSRKLVLKRPCRKCPLSMKAVVIHGIQFCVCRRITCLEKTTQSSCIEYPVLKCADVHHHA